jgi:hypothetical protein
MYCQKSNQSQDDFVWFIYIYILAADITDFVRGFIPIICKMLWQNTCVSHHAITHWCMYLLNVASPRQDAVALSLQH